MLLARRGHRVLLLDRAPLPSDTLSTHAVLRTGVVQLTRWGLIDRVTDAGTPAVRQIVLGFGDERIPFAVREEFGVGALFAPRRTVLDAILLEAAVEAGVEVRIETAVKDLLRDADGTVKGVVAGRTDDIEAIPAGMVIGADGVWSRVARLVDAPTYQSHRASNAIHYAYFRGVDVPGFWFQFTPGVNAGAIPTNDGEACVFVGRPVAGLAAWRDDPEGEFDRLLKAAGPDLAERVSAATRVGAFRGTPGLPGFMRRPWGPGWALVGDAGCSKDPISAHGISDALRDAEMCARAVEAALADPARATRLMRRYHAGRDRLALPIYRASEALAGFGWTSAEASEQMRAISAAVRAECEVLESLPAWSAVDGDLVRAR
jgi:2-polyprenyl-6-methoxyphenol hydroxylase-like FAD-dependent oxidoreductase